MKKMKLLTVIMAAILVASVSFTSCDDDVNTTKEPKVELKFNTVTTPMVLPDGLKSTAQTKELAFTSGFITLSAVEFEVEADEDSIEIEFEIEVNTKIDFATGQTNPDISYITIPAGTYEEFEIEIELQDEGDAPAMVLEGTFIDVQEVSHPVRFEYNSGETFEIEREGNIVFATNESALAQITFDPTVWFAEVTYEDLATASKDLDGVIVISETQNTSIFNKVAEGLDLVSEIELSDEDDD